MKDPYILKNISSPDDLKKLPESALPELAEEIRSVIIETTSKNGGHLASNLGMVEPTIAIHRVFDCAGGDRVIFDVGHQAYAHKLLTGRYEKFHTLRLYGGISGLTNKNESLYDTITAGHSGTSLSTAVGIAEANKINLKNDWVVAVIGDGSFTNGMIYEALNQVASEKLRLIIVLNDNGMSISQNVGGLSNYLSYIRTSEGYFNFKTILKKTFVRIPLVGEALVSGSRRIKDFLKRLTNSETWFESFGLEYIGPVCGNDLERFTSVLEEAKQKSSPVIVHMKTKKGLGYLPAENHPEKYHSTGRFEIECEEPELLSHDAANSNNRTYTMAVSDLLCKYAKTDEKICAITAAMTEGCGLEVFKDSYPDRFFDVGIAEEHAITMSGGLSLGGMKPVAVIYSTFAQRVFDQLWHDVSLQDLPMILMLSHCGIVPNDGVTHQGLFDVSLFSQIPNVNIYAPYDETSLEEIFADVVKKWENKITVIRYPKDKIHPLSGNFIKEKDYILRDYAADTDITVLTYGRMASVVENVLDEIGQKRGVRFIVIKKIFPISEEILNFLTEKIIFIEENLEEGGVAQRFSAILNYKNIKNRMKTVAIKDSTIPHGDLASLYKFTGLDPDSIRNVIENY